MFSGNIFWQFIKELFPLYLMFCAVLGIGRLAKGVIARLKGEEDGIPEALNDVIVGFFYAHMLLAIVGVIWIVMATIGSSAEKIVEKAFQMTPQDSDTVFNMFNDIPKE